MTLFQPSNNDSTRQKAGDSFINFTELLEQVTEYCTSTDANAYFSGGIVRDLLIGKPAKDIDIAVEADVADFGCSLARFLNGTYVPVDLPRHIVRVAVGQIEAIATFEQAHITALRSAMDARGIAYLDGLPYLRQSKEQSFFEDRDPHFNEKGNALVAERVLSRLRALGMVP